MFKRDYGIFFDTYTYKDINMKDDIIRYVFSSIGCRKSVFENGGFYYASIGSKAIIGVIGEKQHEIFSEILPSVCFLPFFNQTDKGAFFIGIDFVKIKFFLLFLKIRHKICFF
jgi:hypothetical protein